MFIFHNTITFDHFYLCVCLIVENSYTKVKYFFNYFLKNVLVLSSKNITCIITGMDLAVG